MAYEEKNRVATKPHSLTLEERGKLSVTGVMDVERFDEDEIVMITSRGALIVRGADLHVGKLSLDLGEISIEGIMNEINYEETTQTGSLWSRLFG